MRLEGPHQKGVQELMHNLEKKMALPAFSALFSLKFPRRNVALSEGKLHPGSSCAVLPEGHKESGLDL